MVYVVKKNGRKVKEFKRLSNADTYVGKMQRVSGDRNYRVYTTKKMTGRTGVPYMK